ncbi:PEP-CTERM sorting domain-containing protein [Roseateles sp. GG27B]
MNIRPIPVAISIAFALAAPAAMAQSFLPGGLIVSRTVYSGVASTVTVGQSLPGGGMATNNGSFPFVFKNEVPDPSFGVTSAIYLDQWTANGGLINKLAVDASQVTSSFASKSELGLNVSTDGKSVSFMGYKSPVNALDVSNSNTAAAYDSTNLVTSTVQRAIVNVSLANGATQIIGVNAYSGNNGRAAVLANGNYYMVGNAGNGSASGTVLSQLSDNTGVQKIAANSSGNSTAVGAVIGTSGSATGYQRGFGLQQVQDPTKAPGVNYAADKSGKDDNFRGMTVFDGTLFVTKGSGSNGINTVYQVGAKGALSNGGSIDNATVSVLPGFNALSEKVAETKVNGVSNPQGNPFGLWFANSTTLFVADEGDGVRSGVTGKNTSFAGLQEWTLSGGIWSKAATFQSGLLTQASYLENSGATYDATTNWHVQTDGLRNIAGRVNANGSFTIYATTSTVSDELSHDQGADRNEIVSITIGTGSTNANTSFTMLETAAYGARFGGVALSPVPEPTSNALMLAGLAGLGLFCRRLQARAKA